jgi:hypothetical protein
MIARALVALSSGIILALGAIHLAYTFFGPKLTPRDPSLQAAMKAVAPVISTETTMWNTWVGFNASHSLGMILFGLVYGHLALIQPAVLFQSRFLLLIGFVFLMGFAILGKAYWFSVPLAGILVALACYVAGVIAYFVGHTGDPV